jgi:hypothetical protein
LHGRHPTSSLALAVIVTAALAAPLLTAGGSSAGQTGITVHARCPENDRGPIWPPHLRSGVRDELVPTGAKTLSVCAYNGANATRTPQFGLSASGATADGVLIRQVTAELDALEPTHGVINCPADLGNADVVTFAYASGPPVVITVGTTGCNAISNGHIQRIGLGGPPLAAIERQARARTGMRWATVIGHLRLCGGPANRCYIESFNSADRVVINRAGRPFLAMAQMHHGRFRLQVAGTGSYRIQSYTGNKLIATRTAELRSSHTTRVVFLIPVM